MPEGGGTTTNRPTWSSISDETTASGRSSSRGSTRAAPAATWKSCGQPRLMRGMEAMIWSRPPGNISIVVSSEGRARGNAQVSAA